MVVFQARSVHSLSVAVLSARLFGRLARARLVTSRERQLTDVPPFGWETSRWHGLAGAVVAAPRAKRNAALHTLDRNALQTHESVETRQSRRARAIESHGLCGPVHIGVAIPPSSSPSPDTDGLPDLGWLTDGRAQRLGGVEAPDRGQLVTELVTAPIRGFEPNPSGPLRAKKKALLAGPFASGETRTRTGDTTIFSRVLYQLSYLAAGA